MNVPFNVLDFLERGAQVFGDRTAVVDEPSIDSGLGVVTYSDLRRHARSMAAELGRMGVAVGDRVAIVSPNAAKFLVSLFGVSGYGRILVPINFRLNGDEIRYILEHSGASVVLVDPELQDTVAGTATKQRIVLDGTQDHGLFYGSDDPEVWTPPSDEETVSVNYTSGTTARPKGVQLTHRNCWLNAVTLGWHAGVSDRDVYLHTLPTFHCNGWGMPYAVAAMGCKQVIVRKIDGEAILDRIKDEGVTLLCAAPAVVAAILDAASKRDADDIPGRGTVRILVAGAPPPSKTIERVETELGWEFMQLYGLTETAPLVTFNRAPREWDDLDPPERAQRLARAGVPAVGVAVDVSDDGEILTRSNNVFAGYWEQPDETAKAVVDGWFHTGDGGYRDGPYVVISDRKKDVIISGGENVSSIEVEDCLYQHPAVAEACVIGVPDEKWGETVKALVVVAPGAETSEQELIDHCRSVLAHYKCPTSVEFRDALERTATGKLQKFRMRAPYWEGRQRQVN